MLAGALLVFIETLENFGVPFVLAEDMPIFAVEAFKLFIGETAPNPASAGVLGVLLILTDGAGAAGPAPLPVGPPLRHQRAPGAADPQGRRAGCRSLADALLLDHRAAGAGAVLRHRRAVLPGVPRPRAARAISAWPISPPCSTASLRPLLNTLVFATLAAALCVTLIGVPIGYVVTRYRARRRHPARRRGHAAVCRRRHRARHRLRRVVQQRHAGADRRAADPGAGLHRAQSAVRRALGQRHRAPDRRLARGGLDQPRPLAAADLPAHRRAADAGRHPERRGADLGHRGVGAQRHRRALQRPLAHHDGGHVPGARRQRRRHRHRRRLDPDRRDPASRSCCSIAWSGATSCRCCRDRPKTPPSFWRGCWHPAACPGPCMGSIPVPPRSRGARPCCCP